MEYVVHSYFSSLIKLRATNANMSFTFYPKEHTYPKGNMYPIGRTYPEKQLY